MGRLTGCCGCFDLRDGSRAVGVTQLVLASLQFVIYVVGFAMLLGSSQQQSSQMNPALMVQIVGIFATILLHIVMNALLVHGVNKKRRSMLLAWLIYSGIALGLESIAVIIVFILLCIIGLSWFIILVTLAVAGLVGVFWYWFVVVLHCYQEMRDANGFVYGNQKVEGEPEQYAV